MPMAKAITLCSSTLVSGYLFKAPLPRHPELVSGSAGDNRYGALSKQIQY